MSRTATPLLTRLRRHRGWWALAVAVLLLKLVSSSVCLGDAPAKRLAVAQTAVGVAAMAADIGGDDGCLLGEAGDCHCNCSHSLTVASADFVAVLPPSLPRMAMVPRIAGHVPDASGSLLRPPIA